MMQKTALAAALFALVLLPTAAADHTTNPPPPGAKICGGAVDYQCWNLVGGSGSVFHHWVYCNVWIDGPMPQDNYGVTGTGCVYY